MTRTITLIIAASALALTCCQEGTGLEEAPEDQGEEGADIEKASGLSSVGVNLATASKEQGAGDQLAAQRASCADLAEQHKVLSEQIAKIRLQQANAAKMMAALEARQPDRESFDDDATYEKAHAAHQAKVDAAQHKVANLDAQLESMEDQEQALRDKMVKAGCADIPESPEPSKGSTVDKVPAKISGAQQALPSIGSGEPVPSPAPGGTAESGSASSSSSDSTIRNLK